MQKHILLTTIILITPLFTVQAQTLQAWEKCVEKVGQTIDTFEVGNIGYENEIKKQCGVRPATTITQNQFEKSLPSDLIVSTNWKERFQKLMGKQYENIKSSLTVSSPMQRDGNWFVGNGYDPRDGGSSKAIIAINPRTNKVLAAYIDATGALHFYGFNENSKDLPKKLTHWLSEESAAG